MSKIRPNLWFDGQAEEAARFWTGILPDSRIDRVHRAAADTPAGPKGMVLTVEFTLAGQPFVGINGGPDFTFSEAVSFEIECADQAEIDRYWEALTADGGRPGPCGWLKDKYGLSWQVVPRQLIEWINSDDAAAAERAMQAMLRMGKLDVEELRRAYEGAAVEA